MRILALDAALGSCSAALVVDGIVASDHRCDDPRGATVELTRLVQAVLEQGALEPTAPGFDCVAVTVGPGSFTGIRAALALAHGLAIGAGVPVFGISSVAAVTAAWTPVAGTALWVALDTRRGHVFLGWDGQIAAVKLDALPRPNGAVTVAGDAAAAVAGRIGAGLAGISQIDARFVAVAAENPDNRIPPQPLYVEPPAARTAQALRPAPV